jgi:hypothetical protein
MQYSNHCWSGETLYHSDPVSHLGVGGGLLQQLGQLKPDAFPLVGDVPQLPQLFSEFEKEKRMFC